MNSDQSNDGFKERSGGWLRTVLLLQRSEASLDRHSHAKHQGLRAWQLGLDKWLPAMWMLVNGKNGTSLWEIHRCISEARKTGFIAN